MKNYKIKIQEPCNENWSKMTPNEKGRFCELCSKTVVDFTRKSTEEIKEYFLANRGNKICGHLKKTQLDNIVIQIPKTVFEQQLTFQKIFLLALLLTMGSVLFSCKTDGKTQNIDKIELLDEYRFDEDGFDEDGFDGDGFNGNGFDQDGLDEDGYDEGLNTRITPRPHTLSDNIGTEIKKIFDAYRFDKDGFDKNGLDIDGLDINGYNEDEINEAYNQDGYDKEGYDKKGFDERGYDKEGYDEDGNIEDEGYEGGMGLIPEIPPMYDEIGSKIVQLLSSIKEKSQDININISIDNLGKNERISVKTVSEEIKQKIVRHLKLEIIPLIAVEVKKDSYCDFFEYNYKLTV